MSEVNEMSKAVSIGVRLLLAGVLVLIGWTRPAHADTIYSNFSATSPGYDINAGYAVSGSSVSQTLVPQGPFTTAMAFTSSGNYDLSQIDLALTFIQGTNSFDVTINSDSAGTPGAGFVSWSGTGVPAFGSTGDIVQALVAMSTIALASGDRYWIEVTPGAPDTYGVWNYNNSGATGLRYQPYCCGVFTSDTTNSAFDVLGTPVATPEPSSSLLLASGLFALGLLTFRSRRQANRLAA